MRIKPLTTSPDVVRSEEPDRTHISLKNPDFVIIDIYHDGHIAIAAEYGETTHVWDSRPPEEPKATFWSKFFEALDLFFRGPNR
jgi:hypothetical protein